MACVDLMLFLITCEGSVFRIDDDDEVTRINVWREDCFVFTAEQISCCHSDVTDDFAFGINDVPSALDVSWFC